MLSEPAKVMSVHCAPPKTLVLHFANVRRERAVNRRLGANGAVLVVGIWGSDVGLVGSRTLRLKWLHEETPRRPDRRNIKRLRSRNVVRDRAVHADAR